MSPHSNPSSNPFPSPSSSIADSILPTPDQPYSSRRSSLISPQINSIGYTMSPNANDDDTPKKPYHFHSHSNHSHSPPDVFSSASIPPIPPPAAPPGMTFSSNRPRGMSQTQRRSATNPTPSSRAPAPPPILLRRPTDLGAGGSGSSAKYEDIPLATGSSTSSGGISPNGTGLKSGGGKGGLNILGLPSMTGSIERDREEEENDSLADLLPSPQRSFFGQADPAGAPASPAWQSFEPSPRIGGGSPLQPHRHKSRNSLDVPFSPLGPRSGERKFEPTPTHGLHARNLSLFFPQPGDPKAPGRRTSQHLEVSPVVTSPEPLSPAVMPAGESEERKVFGGAGDWSFGKANGNGLEPATPDVKRSKRRGHHHKHSLSHNFFSFLDPTQTNPALGRVSPALTPSHSPKPVDTPHPVPMPLLAAPSVIPSSPTLSPLPPSKHSSKKQMLGSFAILEFLIGAGLWVEGQMSGWRCLAGVGYLVVFDAMGVGVSMLGQGEGGWSSVRRPYGTTRFLSLMYFAQSLFLVFAAVYIAKESLEQVILGAGAHEHGGGGAHSHGEPLIEGDERPFPHLLLISATLTSLFSGGGLANHGKLVEAVGSLFLPFRYTALSFVKNHPSFLGNPFSLTIAGMSGAILLGSILVPLHSLHSLDSTLSLLLTVLTTALAYPPTLAFGHVLLQTAPAASTTQMKTIRRALKDIADDQRVLGIGTTRCWSIGATAPVIVERPACSRQNSWSGSPINSVPSSPRTPNFGSPQNSPTTPDFGSGNGYTIQPSSYPSKSNPNPSSKADSSSRRYGEGPISPLVVSLTVHVHPDLSDKDVLDITRMAWSKISVAVSGSKAGRKAGGEISVGIKRGWEGVEGSDE